MNQKLRTVCLSIGLACAWLPVQADDLLQVYQQALNTDPILQQAKANRDAAYDRIGQSRASLLPQLNGTVTYSDTVSGLVLGESDTFRGSVTLNQTIYNHANYVNLDLTKQAATQLELTYGLQVQSLILRVSQAYFDVLTAQDNLEFVKANKQAIERQLEQTKQRFAVGLTAITDVHEAQAQFDLAVADEIQAENTLDNSYEALSEITGLPHRDLNILDTDRFSPSQPTPSSASQWVVLAEESSIQLGIDRIGVGIAKRQIDLAQTGHLPNLGVSATYNDTFGEGTSSFSGDSTTYTVQLSVPIFSGFSVTNQVKEAKDNFVGAQQVLEQSHRRVVRDLRAGLNNVNASISSIRAFEQSVVSAESALKATEAGFDVGTRTIVDVLNATQQLFSAKQQLSSARYNYILAILSLKQAAGTLSDEDVAMINKGLKAPESQS